METKEEQEEGMAKSTERLHFRLPMALASIGKRGRAFSVLSPFPLFLPSLQLFARTRV